MYAEKFFIDDAYDLMFIFMIAIHKTKLIIYLEVVMVLKF